MIAIFDYGAGNLRSVQNTLGEIGATYQLVRDSEGLRQASKIILPGVGHTPQLEVPGQVTGMLTDWLDRHFTLTAR